MVLPEHDPPRDGIHGALDVIPVDGYERLSQDVPHGIVATVMAKLAEEQLGGEALHREVRDIGPAEAVEEAVRAELEVVLAKVERPKMEWRSSNNSSFKLPLFQRFAGLSQSRHILPFPAIS